MLRSVAAAQLRDIGVGHVSQASGVKEARLMLEQEPFDIVMCNREFEGSGDSGQDLLDELRRENLLPHATVFVMVTCQATYNQVVEAGEAALDALLVRPYTATRLAERLADARHRKRELGDVLRALDAGETEAALVRAIKRFQDKRPYWLYCGRLAAELLLTLQRPRDAQTLFERLLQVRPGATWARLGLARARMAQGELRGARSGVAEALAAEPRSADAHDLFGRILVEQCDFDAALAAYRAAAELTPGCLLRAQHAGALAFYVGHGTEALRWLERTLSLGVQSKLFDALSLLLIAMLRFDLGDAAGVDAMRQQLRRYHQRFPQSRRLQRLDQAADALAAMLGGQPQAALRTVREQASEAMADDFDLEAANVALALWARMPAPMRLADEHEAMLERIGMRFCSSKAVAEVLVAAARSEDLAVAAIRRCQTHVATVAERAMEQSLGGDPEAAARQLLAAGEQCFNPKLLEMAGQIARRHASSIPDASRIAEQAAAVMRRACRAPNHIAGIQRSGRSPGGLQVRGVHPAQVAHAD